MSYHQFEKKNYLKVIMSYNLFAATTQIKYRPNLRTGLHDKLMIPKTCDKQ